MRFVVVTSAPLAAGFRLAGVETVVVERDRDPVPVVQALAALPDVGLLVVTDDIWSAVPQRTRATLESLPSPIVLGVPAGAGAPLEAAGGEPMLEEALERAIGHRVELNGPGVAGGGAS